MNPSRPRRAPTPFSAWSRDHADRKLAGVCSALAHAWDLPVAAVRAGFVVAGLLPGLRALSVMTYLGLWLSIPARPGEPAKAQSAADFVLDWMDDVRESFFDEDPRGRGSARR